MHGYVWTTVSVPSHILILDYPMLIAAVPLFQNVHNPHVKCVRGQCSTKLVFYVIYYALPDDDPFRVETCRRKLKKIWCFSDLCTAFTSAHAGVYISILLRIVHEHESH
jgi:hypothetical protein